MLSVEMKINGKPIGTVEATRHPEFDDGDTARYWTHMDHDRRATHGDQTGRSRFITHKPEDGAWELVRKILTDPPAQVATVEELDALPLQAVVLVGGGLAVQRDDDGWYAPGTSYTIEEFTDDAYPMTVLWLPKES